MVNFDLLFIEITLVIDRGIRAIICGIGINLTQQLEDF